MLPKDLTQVAWIGDSCLKGRIRGVVVDLHGLNHTAMKTDAGYAELEWGAAGGLIVFPYCGPWSWMNRGTRRFVNELISAVYRRYKLSKKTPLIITGASMGGLGALIYTRYTRHPVKACAAVMPVCDLKHHFTERFDLPRTILEAFRGYPGTLEKFFKEQSPLHQAAHMPDIPYFLIHGDKDSAVNKKKHSDRLVTALRKHGRKTEYAEISGMGHGEHMTYEAHRRKIDFVKKFLTGDAA